MSAHRVSAALGATLDAQALNDEQARALFDPSEEIDSAMERVAALARHGAPQGLIDALLEDLAAVWRSNAAERQAEQTAAGQLDGALRSLDGRALRRALGVKSLARAVRPLLADLDQAGAAGVMAQRALQRLVAEHPETLGMPSLRHELGARRHDALVAFAQEQA